MILTSSKLHSVRRRKEGEKAVSQGNEQIPVYSKAHYLQNDTKITFNYMNPNTNQQPQHANLLSSKHPNINFSYQSSHPNQESPQILPKNPFIHIRKLPDLNAHKAHPILNRHSKTKKNEIVQDPKINGFSKNIIKFNNHVEKLKEVKCPDDEDKFKPAYFLVDFYYAATGNIVADVVAKTTEVGAVWGQCLESIENHYKEEKQKIIKNLNLGQIASDSFSELQLIFSNIFRDEKTIKAAREVSLKGNARETCKFYTSHLIKVHEEKGKIKESLEKSYNFLNELLEKAENKRLLRSFVYKQLTCEYLEKLFWNDCRIKKSLIYEIEVKTATYPTEVNIYPLIKEMVVNAKIKEDFLTRNLDNLEKVQEINCNQFPENSDIDNCVTTTGMNSASAALNAFIFNSPEIVLRCAFAGGVMELVGFLVGKVSTWLVSQIVNILSGGLIYIMNFAVKSVYIVTYYLEYLKSTDPKRKSGLLGRILGILVRAVTGTLKKKMRKMKK